VVAQSGAVAGRRGEHGRGLTSKLILLSEAAGNVTVASGFAMGTLDLVIDVTGWWR
jgi:hypothetical protein